MNAVVPAQETRPSLVAGNRPMAIVPTSMDEAYRLGKAIVVSGMAPRGMDTPEKCMIAIMRGMELGLTPMQAVDKIAVVNGRPTIWGDGAMALVRGSGACEWVRERIDGQGDNQVAVCEAKRKGEPESIQRTFSVADAKKAGLWNKSGPWQQFPARMLQMRARAFALRDLFADVLGGLYLREEIEDEQRQTGRSMEPPMAPPPAPSAPLAPPPPPPATKPEIVENVPYTEVAADDTAAAAEAGDSKGSAPLPEESPATPPAPEHEPFDGEEFLATLTEDLAAAQTLEDTFDTKMLFQQELDMLTRSQREKAEYLFEQAEARIKGASKPAEPDKPAGTEDDLEPPSPAVQVDPFAVPASFKDVEAYRQWILVMVQSASTKEHATLMRTAWATTKIAREELNMAMSTITELRGLVQAKVQQLEAA